MTIEILIKYIKKGLLTQFSNALDKYLEGEGNALNDQDIFGYSLLAWATLENRPKTMALLLKKEAAIAQERAPPLGGETPIALVDQTDADDKTPLMYAASAGSMRYTLLLLENKASLDKVDCQDKTALMHALEAGKIKVAVYLINRGASLKGILKTCTETGTAIDWVELYDLLKQTEVMLPVRRNIHNHDMKNRVQKVAMQFSLNTFLDYDASQIVSAYLYRDLPLQNLFNKVCRPALPLPSLKMFALSLHSDEANKKRMLKNPPKSATKNQKCLKTG